jgi:AmmeMemoRadiSam system protein B
MNIHEPTGSDIFYPSDPDKLTALVSAALHKLPPSSSSSFAAASSSASAIAVSLPAAVITPHAAYEETLGLMGAAYGSLMKIAQGTHPEFILILAPLHSEVLLKDSGYFLFYPDFREFHIPGGCLPVDHHALEMVAENIQEAAGRGYYFEEEPAIELQLPFIKELFGETPVIPLIIGPASSQKRRKLAAAIQLFPPEKTLIIITSNLTGYLPTADADRQAETAMAILSGKRKAHLLEAFNSHEISMCGAHIIDALSKSGYFPAPRSWEILASRRTAVQASGDKTTHTFSALLSSQPSGGIING